MLERYSNKLSRKNIGNAQISLVKKGVSFCIWVNILSKVSLSNSKSWCTRVFAAKTNILAFPSCFPPSIFGKSL